MSADDDLKARIAKPSEVGDSFRSVRLAKLNTLRGMGIDPYPDAAFRTHR